MKIKSVTALYFSPGGTCALAARTAAAAIGPFSEADFTSAPKSLSFTPEDVVVFAAPVFGGRIPGLFADFLGSVSGGGAKAVCLAVYGARAYEDALLELADAVKARGFAVVAGGAFVARHSMVTELAAERPNEADRAELTRLGQSVRARLECDDFAEPEIPGARPYKKYGGVPMHPEVNLQKCVKCGLCARECPAGAIPADDPTKTDTERCVTCMHCVFVCPNGARALNPVVLAASRTSLKKVCDENKPNELFGA